MLALMDTVLWDNDDYPSVQSGQVVAIKSSEQVGDMAWGLGVVRWLKRQDKGRLRIGIELLASHAQANAAQVIKNGQLLGYFLRCFVLPAQENLGIPSMLITPTIPFSINKVVAIYSINNPEELTEIKLTKLIDSTGSHKRFEFLDQKTTESKPAVKQEQKQLDSVENDIANELSDEQYDDIWGEL